MDAKQALLDRGIPIKDFTHVEYVGTGRYHLVNPFFNRADKVKLSEAGFTIVSQWIIDSDPFYSNQHVVIRDVEWKPNE